MKYKFTYSPVFILFIALLCVQCGNDRLVERPNIILINAEDIGPAWGCLGDKLAKTPNLDLLAKESVLFTQTYAVAPICAPSRSTLVTGMYPTTLGTEHLRSETLIPPHIRNMPQLLSDAGYFTTLYGKTDYNTNPEGHWEYWEPDEAPWRKRKNGKPFLSVFTLAHTHEGKANSYEKYMEIARDLPDSLRQNMNNMQVPPYYPDNVEARALWSRYYELISAFDQKVGDIIHNLIEDKLFDDTIIFIYSDHGFGMPRYKRWLNKSGLHVPFLVYIPKKYSHLNPYGKNSKTNTQVSFVDFVPTILFIAGVQVPEYMQGKIFLGEGQIKRKYTLASRGRADNAYEMSRAIKDDRYIYIRHFMPHLPYIQKGYIFSDEKEAYRLVRHSFNNGSLPVHGKKMFMKKPVEEMYDLENDPFELNNLANTQEYQNIKERLKRELKREILSTRDIGFLHESEIEIRRGKRSPYELALDENDFNLEKIYNAAEKVGMTDYAELVDLLTDDDSAIRFWAIMGLHQHLNEVKKWFPRLKPLLNDPSECVQIAAAELICNFGKDHEALALLSQTISHSNQVIGLQAARSLELSAIEKLSILPEVNKVLVSKMASPGSDFPYKDYNYAAFIAWSLEEVIKNPGHSVRDGKQTGF